MTSHKEYNSTLSLPVSLQPHYHLGMPLSSQAHHVSRYQVPKSCMQTVIVKEDYISFFLAGFNALIWGHFGDTAMYTSKWSPKIRQRNDDPMANGSTQGVVWCGVVWCGVVWCGVVWCGVVWCGVVWCGVVWCGVVWCGVVCRRRCYQKAMAGMSTHGYR